MGGDLLSMLMAGGPVIMILAALSVISIALIAYKAVELRGVTNGAPRREEAVAHWEAGKADDAARLLSEGAAPADRVAHHAVTALKDGAERDALEVELVRQGNEEAERMGRNIRAIEVIALISPLLGLLGTVLGMIQSFQELELAEGAANASVLAGGIWQALLTTAAGLIVAIPAMLGANLLAARTDRARHQIEDTATRILLIAKARGMGAAR